MARILNLFLEKKASHYCKRYPSHAALFEGLEQEEPEAIRCLSAKVSASVFKIGKNYRLSDEDIEELICDCITLILQKINQQQYVFQGYDPGTFVIEIAKNKARNFSRSALKQKTVDMDSIAELEDRPDFVGTAETEMLEKLLGQLDANCQNLIRLKYLEQCRDKALIQNKTTQYTTVDALKNNRARCMKKLVELAANTANLYR